MYARFGKRLFDILVSSIALAVLLPLMLLVSIAIRLEDGGPALFRQKRVGQNGRLFVLLKFRSMPVNTSDTPSAKAGMLKVTRVGAFIRRTNIDELPQLINILRGDMSIVGPRPALPTQKELCELREKLGALHCKPGLTGLAQVHSYTGMPETEKATWDAKYSEQITFVGDLVIIFRTFGYLLKPPPVY